MHWSLTKAQELIDAHPDRDIFVCASGISPSGHIHIGNFRELITTYFVVKALQKLGKKARFIFSWDDFDRFRKVPKNVDPSYEQYLGLPYADIPDPYGCCESYAKHFQNEFETAIEAFDIEVDFIYQHEAYRSGRYNDWIAHALGQRGRIYDLLMEYKTQEASEEERVAYYPVAVYCHGCGKDHTTISAYDADAQTLAYTCTCGFGESQGVLEADNIKLNWKVDWPMRWQYEDVVFEPGGRDHSSQGGSYEVSSRIAREIFGFEPPSYIAYEFIGIKGARGKMSSSTGNLITPADLLQVYTPEVVLYIFSKYDPGAAFNFGFDEEVIRNFTEFERFRKRFISGQIPEEDNMHMSLELADLGHDIDNHVTFGKVAGLLPLMGFQEDAVAGVLSQETGTSLPGLSVLAPRVQHWIENWYPDRATSIRDIANLDLLEGASDEERAWIGQLLAVMETDEEVGLTIEDYMERIYAITRVEDPKETKGRQRRFFALVYQLLIDRVQGPRLPLLLRIVGVDRARGLFSSRS